MKSNEVDPNGAWVASRIAGEASITRNGVHTIGWFCNLERPMCGCKTTDSHTYTVNVRRQEN